MIAWTSYGQDGGGDGVFARRFDARASRVAASSASTAPPPDDQIVGGVASDRAGNFVIAWTGGGQDGSGYGVFAAALRRPAAGGAGRGHGRQRRVRAGRGGGRAAVLAQRERRRADVRRHGASSFSGPAPARPTRSSTASASYGTVANGDDAGPASTATAWRVADRPRGPSCTGTPRSTRRSRPTRRARPKLWRAAPRRQLHRRARRRARSTASSRRCCTTASPAAAAPTTLLPGRLGRARADGGVRAGGARRAPATRRRPAARPCSATCRRRARSAPSSRSWPGAAWPAAAAAGTTARRRRSRASRCPCSCCARSIPRSTRPPARRPMFADVPASSPFCRWIEELARRGVVGGCGGGNYCPAAPVTREQSLGARWAGEIMATRKNGRTNLLTSPFLVLRSGHRYPLIALGVRPDPPLDRRTWRRSPLCARHRDGSSTVPGPGAAARRSPCSSIAMPYAPRVRAKTLGRRPRDRAGRRHPHRGQGPDQHAVHRQLRGRERERLDQVGRELVGGHRRIAGLQAVGHGKRRQGAGGIDGLGRTMPCRRASSRSPSAGRTASWPCWRGPRR